MQIDPQLSVGAVPRMDPQTPAVSKPQVEQDRAAFTQSHALEREYQETPVIRIDKVEKAMCQIGQVDYPPPQVIRRLASLLAMSIEDRG